MMPKQSSARLCKTDTYSNHEFALLVLWGDDFFPDPPVSKQRWKDWAVKIEKLVCQPFPQMPTLFSWGFPVGILSSGPEERRWLSNGVWKKSKPHPPTGPSTEESKDEWRDRSRLRGCFPTREPPLASKAPEHQPPESFEWLKLIPRVHTELQQMKSASIPKGLANPDFLSSFLLESCLDSVLSWIQWNPRLLRKKFQWGFPDPC